MQLHILPRWFGYDAMALFGVILVRRGVTLSTRTINHERIHFAQQREMLFLPFLAWYALEFVVLYIQCEDWHTAYRNISFEHEAYANESNLAYLVQRKPYAWWKYLLKKQSK